MTTNVIVKPANYPTKVTIIDEYRNGEAYTFTKTVEYVLAGEEKTYYCTTNRSIEVVDVEYDRVEGSREAAGIED